MSIGIKRVNYFASNFGFVGWECFSEHDSSVTNKIIAHNLYQMGRMIDEIVECKIVEM